MVQSRRMTWEPAASSIKRRRPGACGTRGRRGRTRACGRHDLVARR